MMTARLSRLYDPAARYIEPVAVRASVLIERAHACAAGFDRLGRTFSADLTRGMIRDMEAGAPAALYEHWIGAQEARLRGFEDVAS